MVHCFVPLHYASRFLASRVCLSLLEEVSELRVTGQELPSRRAGINRQIFRFADDPTAGWRVDQVESTNYFDYGLTGERCAYDLHLFFRKSFRLFMQV